MKKILLCLTLVLCGSLLLTGCNLDEAKTNNEQSNVEANETIDTPVAYSVKGGETGEYGKVITLNANTDAPAVKYLYKFPSGTYTVTTDAEKVINISVVKDQVANTGTAPYTEELNYVTSPQNLTGSDNMGSLAVKEYEITLNDDESVLINGNATVTFTKK